MCGITKHEDDFDVGNQMTYVVGIEDARLVAKLVTGEIIPVVIVPDR